MVRIAVGQLCSTESLLRNGKAAAKLVAEAASGGAKVLFLPEASDYIARSPAETLGLAKAVDQSPFMSELRVAVTQQAQNGLPIEVSVGVHEPADDGSTRIKNTLLWLDTEGKIVSRYAKLHLFDAEIANGPILKESNSVEPGNAQPSVIQSSIGPVGTAICYDIRFPELAIDLRNRGAKILQYPSAFTVKTGQAHWKTLNCARAIDNQCFVVSAAQAGRHTPDGSRESYGHALVVDPWGSILAEAQDLSEQVCFADLDFDELDEVRQNMPFQSQRRYKSSFTLE